MLPYDANFAQHASNVMSTESNFFVEPAHIAAVVVTHRPSLAIAIDLISEGLSISNMR